MNAAVGRQVDPNWRHLFVKPVSHRLPIRQLQTRECVVLLLALGCACFMFERIFCNFLFLLILD